METKEKTNITVTASINAPIEKVWKYWTEPEHIVKWNQASEDWHTTKAENDLKVGGKFLSRMEAKDGSYGFDFGGIYDQVKIHELIEYTLSDDRKVKISFKGNGEETTVTETFEAESMNSIEMQREGWQAILDNFKKHVESSGKLERLHFEAAIKAPVKKVYDTMLDDQHYREWTGVFSPGSYFEGSWEKGSKILFLGPNESGSVSGMVSKIKENVPLKFVSIEHQGFIENGKEVTSGPEAASWAGAMENYTFHEENGETVISIEMDTNNEYTDYFKETWPKALEKLKSICES